MRRVVVAALGSSVLMLTLMAMPRVASAHIALVYPPPRTDALKEQHCGALGSTRGPVVTAMQSGSTLTVQWLETVDHPGHYRISFDDDGQDFIIPPTATGTTAGDPTVIADLIPDISGAMPEGGRPYSFDITLPDIECTNCTLQIIQLMTDKPPYTTTTTSDDIYFQCADLVLSRTAPPPPDAGVPVNPDAPGSTGPDAPGGTPADDSGGCAVSGAGPGSTGAGGLGFVMVIGLVFARARGARRV